MVAENCRFKVDAAGRVIIPAHLRKKFGIVSGDYMEYYTDTINGKDVLIITKESKNGKAED